MVALANRRSASASEIVTGALQDHDRGLVVGETTWGKALVQSIYRLSEGAGLALTTAHYFTPAGRLIQRPWDESFDEYLSYTTRDQEAERCSTRRRELKYTLRLGRKVYSGGGIEPDHRMPGPIEGFNPGKFARRLYPTMFANYAQRFDREGDTRFGMATDQKARRTLTREFAVDDAMLQDFKAFVKSQLRDPSQFDEAGFNADRRVHPRDDSLRDRRRAVRRGDGAPAPARERPAGAIRADALPRGGEAAARDADEGTQVARVVAAG